MVLSRPEVAAHTSQLMYVAKYGHDEQFKPGPVRWTRT